jgi:hypothetical protein
MFFTNNFNAQNINRARQRNRQRQQRQEEDYNEDDPNYNNQRRNPRNNKAALIMQLLPLFVLMLFSVFPSIFQSVKFTYKLYLLIYL